MVVGNANKKQKLKEMREIINNNLEQRPIKEGNEEEQKNTICTIEKDDGKSAR